MIKKISIIFIILLTADSFAHKDINILSSDYNSLVIEYLPGIDTSSVIIDFQKFYKISLNNGNYPVDPGKPSVPLRILNIGVPSEFGNTIEILQSSYKLISGRIVPVPNLTKDNELAVPKYILGDNYYSVQTSSLIDFGEFGYIREMPVQNIEVHPVEYDPEIQQIKLYNRIIFRINFSREQKIVSKKGRDELLEDAVLNYNIAGNWVKEKQKLNKVLFNSVLSGGKWFRFEAPEEGIYRIQRSQLSSFGIDPAAVDPRTIKIYNNGGKPLPENIFTTVPLDLEENAIIITGESDGKFDEGDYILFYGRGTNFWEYDSLKKRIERRINPYSKENYFFITSGGLPGKRIQDKVSSEINPDLIRTATKAFRYLEEEKINIVRSGRTFVGDEFNESVRSRSYMNQLNSRVQGVPVTYEFRFINSDLPPVNLTIEEQQTVIYNKNIPGTSSVTESLYTSGNPTEGIINVNFDFPENRSVLKFTFNASGFLSKGYLDFFDIRYEQWLSPAEDELIFFAPDTSAMIEYQMSNFSGTTDLEVFDITSHSDVKRITNPLMRSGGEYRFRSAEIKSGGGKYIALRESKYKTPVNAAEVGNSNVHGLEPGKYIIITHKNFIQQASRLKDFRETASRNKMTAAVADVNEIFNEFSAGIKDPAAIRNFIKYAYDNWEPKPEYVVLFGDGDYDYRNIEGFNRNYVIPYEIHSAGNEWWRNIHHIFSYPTDDFFVRVSGNDVFIDLAVGRLNIQSTADAERVVNKIIKYESESGKGNWRNLITMLADDAYTSKDYEGVLHVDPSERVSLKVPGSFDINKIYMSMYPVEHTSAGRRKPGVTKSFVEAINNGTVLFNFIGHGSPSLWTHEVVFENSATIPMLRNEKLFFLVAATCDFGYFDNPSDQSGTELLVLKENSGAIGGFTASRPVYAWDNSQLLFQLFERIFYTPRDSNQLPPSIGKIYMLLRSSMHETNDMKYHVFGDPALKLAFPQYPAEITTVNGQNLAQPVQIQALGKVHVDGIIKKDSITSWNDYNGEGILSVYDSYRIVKLNDVNYNIRVQGGLIFRGIVSVAGGSFGADFTVPKDISYEDRNGKIVLYFYNEGNDGVTSTQNIIVNGTDTTAVNDGKGPELEVYFDNPEFRNAYLINPNSELIIKLKDETGLNTTGTGIGHLLEGILNDKENEPIDFSNYFTGDKDAGGKSGEVRYKFTDLAEGDYKIHVKAWDVFNNFSSETEYFSVINSGDLELRDIYNYPNPFKENTVFTFQQNLKTAVDVKIKVYSVAGRLVRNLEIYGVNEGFVKIPWDGRDEEGNRIANGTYLYKVVVTTTDGAHSRSALGKLAVIY